MKTPALVALASLFLLSACDRPPGEKDRGRAVPADNTKVNERDRKESVTALDQSNLPADLETTQKIRQALLADDTLSMDAKNIKVITSNGVVTIRGPVKSDAERTAVQRIALQNVGTNRVDFQIEVAAPRQ